MKYILDVSVITLPSVIIAEKERGSWFKGAKYGVFVHFLGGGPHWNEKVNSFDVKAFAAQMEQARAGYVMFTLGQNSGYYCSPNTTYNKYTGYEAGDRCSERDLPMELADSLLSKKIKLMLYLPSRAPQSDKHAMKCLEDVDQQQPAPQEFTRKWSAVIAEWSTRYGTKVSGWWFDGSYNTIGWDDLSQPYNWNTWAKACRAGNPNSILAFNPGTDITKAFESLTEQQDYTAGEQNSFALTPKDNPATDELQWHLLAHLGTYWAKADGPQNSDRWMIDYIQTVNEQRGVVTMDVNVADDGSVYTPHFEQLKSIAKAIRLD